MRPPPAAPATIVIGYGNELRGDDGIGPFLAAAVAERAWPSVLALAVHQLTPELAEALAGARLAIFIDACAAPEGEPVEVLAIAPGSPSGAPSHAGDPHVLLGLARHLYGTAPAAWWVMVAGHRFGLGQELSPQAQANCRQALEQIELLVHE
jgi:hydrogenase maturation protease